MATDDNPPVGILLVTARNKALVEYAMADSDISLFVSKYMLELPRKEELQRFINEELCKILDKPVHLTSLCRSKLTTHLPM